MCSSSKTYYSKCIESIYYYFLRTAAATTLMVSPGDGAECLLPVDRNLVDKLYGANRFDAGHRQAPGQR